ncbi:MAG: hypothetical protein AB2693_33100 [Candidatus Thiodiazotropha sp.]
MASATVTKQPQTPLERKAVSVSSPIIAQQPLPNTINTSYVDKGAKPKTLTSTPIQPVLFKPDNSVFSPSSSEDDNIDELIKSQLQKIKEINEKYDAFASASFQKGQTSSSSELPVPIAYKSPVKNEKYDTFAPASFLKGQTSSGSQLPVPIVSSMSSKNQLQKVSFSVQNENNTFQFPNLKQPTCVSSTLQLPVHCSTSSSSQTQRSLNKDMAYSQHAHSYQPAKRKHKEPDKFDGKSVEWRDYIVHFDQVSSWNGWNDSEKAQQLAMSLRGQAQKLLGELTETELNSYSELKRILSQRYDPQERSFAYRCEFRARKRQKNESPSDFAYALRRLACLAFPDMPYECREINVLEQYLNTVGSTDLKEHVIFRHPKSLDEAISHTVEYEAVKGNQTVPSKPSNDEGYVQAVKHNQKEIPNTKHNTYEQLNQLIDTMNSCMEKWNKTLEHMQQINKAKAKQSGKNYSNYTCYQCNMKGHIARNCPNKGSTEDNKPYQQSEN